MIFSLLSGRISTLRDETGAVSITMLMYISKLDHIMLQCLVLILLEDRELLLITTK